MMRGTEGSGTPRALTLLRLGRRCGRGTGADGIVHVMAVALAGAVTVLSAWAFVACVAVYEQRTARQAARSPVFATAADAPDAVGWWRAGVDTAYGRQYTVITLVNARRGAEPPPGLSRWPEPGEVFLSPALAGRDDTGVVSRRYGTVAGLISEEGLADPDEYLVYTRPEESFPPSTQSADPPPAQSANQAPSAVRSFGTQHPYPTANESNDIPLSAALEFLVVLVLPAGALLVIAARTGAGRRDARLAMLDALGAPTSARLLVLFGEALWPAVIGVLSGLGAAWLTTLGDVTLPFTQYVIRGADLATARPTLGWVTAAALTVVLGSVLVVQGWRKSRPTHRPTAVAARVRRWPVAVFFAALAITAAGAAVRGNPGRLAFSTGMLVALGALPVAAAWLASALGRAVAAAGNATGRPSAIVGGRWLAARPAVIARTGAVFIISLGLAAQAQVIQTQLTETGKTANQLDRLIGTSVIELHVSLAFPEELRRMCEALDQRQVLRFYYEEQLAAAEPTVRTTVVGTPAALARLGELESVPAVPTRATAAYRQLGAAWSRLLELGILNTGTVMSSEAMRYPDRLLVSTSPPPAGEFATAVVLNDAGAPGVEHIKQLAYRTMAAPNVRVAAEDYQAAAAEYASLVDWLLDLGLFTMIVLVLGGAIAAAGVFVAQSRELGPLSGYQVRRGLYYGISGWNLVLPLAVVCVLGSATATVLGLLLTRLTPHGRLSVPFLGLCLAIALAGTVAVGLGCGEAATRAARRWCPRGE